MYAAGVGLVLLAIGSALLLLFCRTEESAWRLAHSYLRFTLRIVGLLPVRSGYSLPGDPVLLVSNHSSYLDGLLLMSALDGPVVLTPKKEMFGWPIVGRVVRRMGFVPVDRKTVESRHRSLDSIERALRRKRTVHLFPEGTFKASSGILPFHSGGFQRASAMRVRIVPIAIIGARRALKLGRTLPHRAQLEVRVLDAIDPPPRDDTAAINALPEMIRRRLAEAVGEPLCAASLVRELSPHVGV